MRDASAARPLAGNGVLSVIGTSPKNRPGVRTPITRSSPLTTLVISARPSTTTKSARSSPSCAKYSPGTRWMSSTAPARYSRASRDRGAKILMARSPSTVIMPVTRATGPARPSSHPCVAPCERIRGRVGRQRSCAPPDHATAAILSCPSSRRRLLAHEHRLRLALEVDVGLAADIDPEPPDDPTRERPRRDAGIVVGHGCAAVATHREPLARDRELAGLGPDAGAAHLAIAVVQRELCRCDVVVLAVLLEGGGEDQVVPDRKVLGRVDPLFDHADQVVGVVQSVALHIEGMPAK